MLRRIAQVFSLIMTSFFILLGAFCIWLYVSLYTPLNIPASGQVLIIPKGSSLKLITEILQKEKIINQGFSFKLWVKLNNARGKIKAGEYLVRPGTTLKTLLELFISGKVVQHALTVVEGWTFSDLMQAIALSDKLEHTLAAASTAEVMEKVGAKNQHPEGQFFPDTYCFPLGTTDLAFLKRAHEVMQKKLDTVWNARDQTVPLKSPYEVLILASIIEKESSVFEEYAEIAGVYVRRLHRDMPLQADPTVIYGVESVTGRMVGGQNRNGQNQDTQNKNQELPSKKDKREITLTMLKTPNPYNTYLNTGLPPTPIALPSLRALQAATQPAAGETLYFVAKGNGEPGHVFSKTLIEHNVKVTAYRSSKKAANVTATQNAVQDPVQPSTVQKEVKADSQVQNTQNTEIKAGKVDKVEKEDKVDKKHKHGKKGKHKKSDKKLKKHEQDTKNDSGKTGSDTSSSNSKKKKTEKKTEKKQIEKKEKGKKKEADIKKAKQEKPKKKQSK